MTRHIGRASGGLGVLAAIIATLRAWRDRLGDTEYAHAVGEAWSER